MVILVISTIALTLLCAYFWYSAEHWKSQYELSRCELRTTESFLKDSHLKISDSLTNCAEAYVKALTLLKDTNESLSKLWKCIRELLDVLKETDNSHTKTTAAVVETIEKLAKTIDGWDNQATALIELVIKDLSKKSVVKKKTSSDKSTPPKEGA